MPTNILNTLFETRVHTHTYIIKSIFIITAFMNSETNNNSHKL